MDPFVFISQFSAFFCSILDYVGWRPGQGSSVSWVCRQPYPCITWVATAVHQWFGSCWASGVRAIALHWNGRDRPQFACLMVLVRLIFWYLETEEYGIGVGWECKLGKPGRACMGNNDLNEQHFVFQATIPIPITESRFFKTYVHRGWKMPKKWRAKKLEGKFFCP